MEGENALKCLIEGECPVNTGHLSQASGKTCEETRSDQGISLCSNVFLLRISVNIAQGIADKARHSGVAGFGAASLGIHGMGSGLSEKRWMREQAQKDNVIESSGHGMHSTQTGDWQCVF